MAKKDLKKGLTPVEWKKLKKKLRNKVEQQTSSKAVKLRKNLTPEDKAKIKAKTGAEPSTMAGFINALSKKSHTTEPPLAAQNLSSTQSLSEKTLVGENPLSENTHSCDLPEPGKECGGDIQHPKEKYAKETIVMEAGEEIPSNTLNKNRTAGEALNQPSNNNNKIVDIQSNKTESVRAPAVHTGTPLSNAPADEALYSPERNSFDMLKLLQSGNMDASELTIDERVIIVRSLKMAGRTQDEIAAMMRVSRRMVQRDYKRIRELDKHTLLSYELEDLGGEIHALCMHAANNALKDGKHFSVPKILESMTGMLQSMGLVYKAPQKSQVAAMVGVAHTQVGQRAYHNYQDSIEGEREQVLDVLSKMLTGVQERRV
ncbi:MAG: hypothetical protein DRQ39_08455 [Gammaproteobacteria bacterium]|nr:MAG: hypothetical protein DRQ39_08455 [Gammaproteobacteria bacterium]